MKNIGFYSYQKFFLFLTLVFFLGGCEDMLEESPKGVVGPGQFYRNTAQIEGVLARVPGRWQAIHGSHVDFFHDDQIYHKSGGGNLVLPPNQGHRRWSRTWPQVMDLNFAISAFKEGRVEGPASEVKKLEGETHFWRAYCYFILVRLWGDLPLLTDEHTNNYFTQQPSRSPVSDVYDLIISDLETAMEKLPPGPTPVSRPNYDVAKAYLGKVYLTMATAPLNQTEHFRTAADLLWEVIEDGRYQLVEDIRDVFSIQTEPGPEAMLSIVAHEGNNLDYYGYTTMMLHGAWNDYTIEPGWFPRFPDQPRRDAYLEMWSPDGVWFEDLGVRAGLKKYHYWLIDGSNRTYSNISLLRYADVLLSYAEAENLASGGPTANSVWAINQIIDRANDYIPNPNHSLAALSMSMEAFDEKVMDERDLELCYEPPYGRWMDLVRKRLLEEKTHPEYQQNVDENDYLFPIPEVDLRQNPNLTQNPGYPSP